MKIFIIIGLGLFLGGCSSVGKMTKSQETMSKTEATALFTLKDYVESDYRLAVRKYNSISELEELIKENKDNVRVTVYSQLRMAQLHYLQEDFVAFKNDLSLVDERFVFLDPYTRDLIWTTLLGLQTGEVKYFEYTLQKFADILNDSANEQNIMYAVSLLDDLAELNRPYFSEDKFAQDMQRESFFFEFYLTGYNFFKAKFIAAASDQEKKRNPQEFDFASVKTQFKEHYNKQLDVVWQNIRALRDNPYLDPFAQQRDTLKRKVTQAVQLALLMDAKLAKYNFLADDIKFNQLRITIDQFLFQNTVTTELTEESKRLNSIKRKGFIE